MENLFLTSRGFGITSTSANYLANLAQEVILEKKLILENTSFLNSRIITPLCPDGLDYEHANFDLEGMSKIINEIGMMNTFCAWMREGVKAKEKALKKLQDMTIDEWAEMMNVDLPEVPKEAIVTEEDVLDEMSLGERFRMLRAEAIAAAFGKMIHKEMPISEARRQLHYRKLNPAEKTGLGQDITLTVYSPAVDSQEVDAAFVRLQNEQRQAEKELNSFKFANAKKLAEKNADNQCNYTSALDDYKMAKEALRSRFATYVKEEAERIRNLKITVPDSLMQTFDYLNNLGR